MTAPTERSMPAVRMTSVWAAPTMPTMATCCRMRVSENGLKNLPPTRMPKTATDRMSTMSGTAAWLECRKCWAFSSGDFMCDSNDAADVSLCSRTFSNSCAFAIPNSLPAFFDASAYYGKGGHEGRPSVFQ